MWWKKLILMIFLLTKLLLKVLLEDNWSYYDWLCVDAVTSICVDVTKDGNVPSNFPDDAVKTVPKTGSTDNVVSDVRTSLGQQNQNVTTFIESFGDTYD